MKIMKNISGKTIKVGERTLIPIIEISTYSRIIKVGEKSEEIILTGVT